ncbi:uncharacterized protein B0P05DRAFT_256570 [Gilbertella persicaria]|uniref:uncharacterized protein n=1 Tax=Gilbertella persicaria TaxID=101096 RepID=UPI00221EC4B1|nr:uncharacterized protein B0P05DRAFT_256570 [Gilbertella persicaria]KAI8091179.1 hypothetical protein B0P05DRAFT_256570 [Gilbertella persicaria]
MNTQQSTVLNDFKYLVYFVCLVFLEYIYRVFILIPLSTVQAYAKHPIFISLIVVFLFPTYLVAQCIITAVKHMIKIIILPKEQKYLFIVNFFFGYTNPFATHLQRQENMTPSENGDIQKYLERCSICFDAKLDLCLEYCRDQFCTDCFQKYVTEVVKSSWGLGVTKIRCPVCKTHIPQNEWTKHVPESIIELYNKFNQPYRTFSRHCPHCETEMTPCDFGQHSAQKNLSNEIGLMLQDFSDQTFAMFVRIFCKSEWRNSTLPQIHHQLIEQLLTTTNEIDKVKTISMKMLKLGVRSDTWKKLQFDHIFFFPNIQCSTCDLSFCLQCGDDTHKDLTCEENMKQRILQQQQTSHGDDVQSLKWKLEHSRKCPCCSIMIQRDEGCNKVECTMCGFSFCWECRLPWSENCGYFVCATNKKDYVRLTRQGDSNRAST